MLRSGVTGLAGLLLTLLLIGGLEAESQQGEESAVLHSSRVRRDTAEWVRRSDSAPLLQDFRNGTTNNATATVWKKCVCDFNGCDCYAEFNDFNGTRLYFRIDHIKTHTRFRVTFRDENRTVNQQFSLVNGTSCFQSRRSVFDQVCFLRYGQENNTILDKACLAVGVRIQQYSTVSADYECIKYMSDGTTHVGPLNITQPDLNFLANYTLYGTGYVSSTASLHLLVASTLLALLASRFDDWPAL